MIRSEDFFEVTPRPVNPARFGPQTSIRIEIALDQIRATKPSSRANVLNPRATFEKQRDHVPAIPVQRLFQRRPTARAVNRCTTIEQQFRNLSIIDAGCCNEWFI